MKIDFSNINIFHNTPFRSLIELISITCKTNDIILEDDFCLEYKGKYGLITIKNKRTNIERLLRFIITEVGKSTIKKILLIDIRELEKDHISRRCIIKELHDVYKYKPMFISTYLNINRSTVKRNLYDY